MIQNKIRNASILFLTLSLSFGYAAIILWNGETYLQFVAASIFSGVIFAIFAILWSISVTSDKISTTQKNYEQLIKEKLPLLPAKYGIIKCPYCDTLIDRDNTAICPKCGRLVPLPLKRPDIQCSHPGYTDRVGEQCPICFKTIEKPQEQADASTKGDILTPKAPS
jgi:hypothetical protein